MTRKKQIILLLSALVMLLTAFFSFTGLMEKAFTYTGIDTITAKNEAYLDRSFDKSLNGFLVLSGIKSGLAVIEGSEVGVGFNLQVGDIVQSVYDYVDIAWKVSLAGGTVLIIAKLMIQTVAMMNHLMMGVFFVCMFIYLLSLLSEKSNRVTRIFKPLSYFSAIATLALYIVFPLTIGCSAYFSEKITNPLLEDSRSGFEQISKQISAENLTHTFFSDNNTPDESILDKFNLNKKYAQTKQKLKEISLYIKMIAKDASVWTIKLIAGYLFDCILFPLLFFIFLYGIVKGAGLIYHHG